MIPLLAALAAGCAKEGESSASPGTAETSAGVAEEAVITLSLPDALTKTALGEKSGGKYPTLWQEGDCIALNGFSSLPLSAEDAGAASAPFIFRDGLSSPFNYVYPAGACSGADAVVFPSSQRYVEDSFDPAAALMYGSSLTYGDARLNHLSSLVRIGLTAAEDVNLSEISLTALGGAALSGTFTLGKNEDGTLDGSLVPAQTRSTVSYLFEPPLALSAEAKFAYIAIPHGSYPDGFKATVKTSDGKVMVLSFFSEGREVAPSKVLEFPEKEFEAGADDVLYIDSPEDLLALGASDNAVLVSDIDMGGTSWTDLASFTGTLDGLGHTISGLPAPLFNTLSGTVRNLVLASKFVETDNRISGSFVRTMNNGSTLEGCVFTGEIIFSRRLESGSEDAFWGGLVGTAAAGSMIKDCVNQGTVCVRNSYLVNPRLGGIVGRYQGNASGLVNRGSVSYDEDSRAATFYMGGIAGVHNGSSGVGTALRNEGSVSCYGTVTGANNCFIGGITGAHSFGNLTDYVSTESGSIVVDTRKLTYGPKVGGLAGQLTITGSTSGLAVKGSGCHSPMLIICNGKSLDRNISVGGLIGYISQSSTTKDQTIALDGCVHDAPVSVQGLLVGKSTAATGRVDFGGLVGTATPVLAGRAHTLEVRDCSNSGDIRFEGGVKYCYAGGIVADVQCAGAVITDCENRGSILVSGEMDNYTSGGIAGLLLEGHTLTRCKNFCDISRGGLISGTSPAVVAASRCGVGGRVWDGSQWTSPVASDFPRFMYAGWAPQDHTAYPQYYTGCSLWDGSSTLSWED